MSAPTAAAATGDQRAAAAAAGSRVAAVKKRPKKLAYDRKNYGAWYLAPNQWEPRYSKPPHFHFPIKSMISVCRPNFTRKSAFYCGGYA